MQRPDSSAPSTLNPLKDGVRIRSTTTQIRIPSGGAFYVTPLASERSLVARKTRQIVRRIYTSSSTYAPNTVVSDITSRYLWTLEVAVD